jgi:hypothetical protein
MESKVTWQNRERRKKWLENPENRARDREAARLRYKRKKKAKSPVGNELPLW